jgi:type I restriction enzyme S subunit
MDTKALRQKILDLAIRGKLVPQDPNDEPAEVLLERIREQKQQMLKEGKLKKKDLKNDTIIFKGEDNLHYEKFQDGTVKCIEDEIPFEVPEGWEWTRLRSIIHFIRNGATIKQYGDAKGLPITRIETIASGTIDRNRFGYANIFEVGKYESYILKDYDILMSHINSPKHLGKCALYEHEGDEKIIHGMNLLSIRTFSCSLSKYMCIVFRSTVFKDFVWEHMKQAVNQASITTTSISNSLFPLPPEEEQKRIVDFYDDVNKYVTAIDIDKDKIIQDISLVKSKILDLAIRGKLVPQDPNDEPASVLLERIRAEKEELIKQGKIKRDKKESVIFKGDDNSYYEKVGDEVFCIDEEIPYDIPNTWLWMRLENCCIKEIRRGKSPKYTENSNILVFAQKCNTKYNGIDISLAQYLDENTLNRYPADEYMQDGDVVINSTGTGTLGRIGIYRDFDNTTGLSIVPDSHITIIRGFSCICSYYLYAFIKAHQSELEKKGEGSTNQKELKPLTLKEILIAIPPLSEQKRIDKSINVAFSHLAIIEKCLN